MSRHNELPWRPLVWLHIPQRLISSQPSGSVLKVIPAIKMSHILFITLTTFYFNSSLPLFILLAHVMTVTRYITLQRFWVKMFVSRVVILVWFWRYLTRGLIWRLSQSSIRPSIYLSSIVISRSNLFLEPTSTNQ